MREKLVIKDRATAAVFASALPRNIVLGLMAKALSLSGLAEITGKSLSLLHYHVSKCRRLGLIEMVREQGRAGRATKIYRAAAKTIFVPAEFILELPGTELTQLLRKSLDENLTRSLQGVRFRHDGNRPRADLITDADTRGNTIELWLDVGLTRADAAELAKELQNLMDRFRARANDKAPRHLVHVAAVRLQS